LKYVEQNDEEAIAIWEKSIQQLALGIASLSNILSPQTMVIGGGIAEANEKLFNPLKKYLDEYEWRPGGNCTKIVKAHFGEIAGAIGAAIFAKNKSELQKF
jgi:glucokinase